MLRGYKGGIEGRNTTAWQIEVLEVGLGIVLLSRSKMGMQRSGRGHKQTEIPRKSKEMDMRQRTMLATLWLR